MDAVSLREGVMISHFEMLADWQWYLRRGGANAATTREFFTHWIPMLAPATPHIAEEFWQRLGEDKLLVQFVIPNLAPLEEDSVILALESYLREFIDSARNVKGLAERHTEGAVTKCIVQTAASWKIELAVNALKLSDENFDFKKQGQDYLKSLPIFNNEQLRGEIFQLWMALTTGSKKKRGRILTWTNNQKSLVLSGLIEADFITLNSQFIANTIGVESIIAYPVGEGEDVAGKARVAFPLEPGIAFI